MRHISDELELILKTSPIDGETDYFDSMRQEWSVARGLQTQLDLEISSAGWQHDNAYDLLLELVPFLEAVITEGSATPITKRTEEMVASVTADLSLPDVVMLMRGLGWGNTRIEADITIDHLAGHIRRILIERLEARVSTMLRRWKDQGLLELSARRKQRERSPTTLRQKRRDRLSSGQPFQPPGRT